MGAISIPMVVIKATPLNKAYTDANTLAVLVSFMSGSIIGPMPLSIMDAFKRLSYQSISGMVSLYPKTPSIKHESMMTAPKSAFFQSRLWYTSTGASFCFFRSVTHLHLHKNTKALRIKQGSTN